MSTGMSWRWRKLRRLQVVLVAATIVASCAVAVPVVTEDQNDHWVGAWATAPVSLPVPDQSAPSQGVPTPRINNQTVRQVVHTSVGGSQVRVVLTNQYGTEPLTIGAAHLAFHDADATIVSSSGQALTFEGETSATIQRGSTLLSDPVHLVVPPLADLVIDLFLPGDTWATMSPATIHGRSLATSYFSHAGDHSGVTTLPVESTVQSWLFLSRVDVKTGAGTGAIVTVGDSITDGTASTPDTNSRWPDFLASRLVETFGDAAPGVLNVGIAGNRVLSHNGGMAAILRRGSSPDPDDPEPDPNAFFGPAALARFDRDVLLQPGVTHVIVLESINDIGFGFDNEWPTVDHLIAGHRALIQRAHARDLLIYGGTLTPFEGAVTFTETGEAKRQAFNAWIRTSGAYDAVIDFDAAIRDPDHPARILAAYNPGDSIHCNDEGYRVMAEAVDLTLFDTRVLAAAGVGR